MSWLNANEYMVMDVVARDRVEELLETSGLVAACAAREDVETSEGLRPDGAGTGSARRPCWIARAATVGS
jgi:hypothetical protein